MRVCSHKNHLTLMNNDTEINEQKIKATSMNTEKGMDFPEKLVEVSHKFTHGPFNFSPEGPMFELWVLIQQNFPFHPKNTRRKSSTLL